MPESISFSSSSAALDPKSLMSVAPEEPNQCVAPPPSPAPPPPAEPEPPPATAGQKLVVEYDRRGPSCARERTDALRDCSFAALGVVTGLASSSSLALASVGSLARDVLRCTESLVRLDDCGEVAEAKQAAEQRCEDRGGQVIRGDQQVLCWEPRH